MVKDHIRSLARLCRVLKSYQSSTFAQQQVWYKNFRYGLVTIMYTTNKSSDLVTNGCDASAQRTTPY